IGYLILRSLLPLNHAPTVASAVQHLVLWTTPLTLTTEGKKTGDEQKSFRRSTDSESRIFQV
ncbi:hypothetical protein, partial [uncultured Lentilactobacillus sp.]|uniref:hypothetical protein n=1 Tax=uncultured Lentilactobacillus sp. TaxID=2805375 RepID=UPI00259205C9